MSFWCFFTLLSYKGKSFKAVDPLSPSKRRYYAIIPIPFYWKRNKYFSKSQLMALAKESRHPQMKMYASLSVTYFFIKLWVGSLDASSFPPTHQPTPSFHGSFFQARCLSDGLPPGKNINYRGRRSAYLPDYKWQDVNFFATSLCWRIGNVQDVVLIYLRSQEFASIRLGYSGTQGKRWEK